MIEDVLSYLNDNNLLKDILVIVVVLTIAIIAYFVTKRVLIKVIEQIVKRSKNKLDDLFLEYVHYNRIAYLAPLFIINYATTFLSEEIRFIDNILFVLISIILLSIIGSVLDTVNAIYNKFKFEHSKPIKGYIQLFKIFVYLIGSVFVFAILINKSPWGLLSGIGAFTAIIILIFRDTILSFVASLQINSNDLIRIGDWIEVPKFGADGDVIDIALHTIKIQNWDKTITTIPTYKILDESFKNYRGMVQAGGRRIKRSLYIDVNSISFLTPEEIQTLKGFKVLEGYLHDKESELNVFNKDKDEKNQKRLTNIGTFRNYLEYYLNQHPNLNHNMTMMVRQLKPTPNGLPIEIYMFTNTTQWEEYERIQSDIFDHIFAIIPNFNLKVYQAMAYTGS